MIKSFGFEIAIPFDSPLKPFKIPTGAKNYEEHLKLLNANNLISVPKPWKIKVRSINLKKLKTQFNIQIRFSLEFSLSKFKPTIPDHKNCNHNFRILFNGNWNWCLIWECIYCGFLCHCKCFERVINSIKKGQITTRRKYTTIFGKEKEMIRVPKIHTDNDLRFIQKERQININDFKINLNKLPFYKNACEICRGLPSTHKYCHKMYARSEFELRYGAYVKKKFFELLIDNPNIQERCEDQQIERMANNLLREQLGFKKIGQGFVIETELYNIIKSIFPDMEVTHHYHSDWLRGQELDIYVHELKLGIEYDGIQHFKPIAAWGGDEGLKKAQERDRIKEIKCKEQDVTLIRFSYKDNELLNKNFVESKIKSKFKMI